MLLLACWLPLNCCCRMQAMLGMIEHHEPAGGGHICSHAAPKCDPGEPGRETDPDHHDCTCDGHDAVAVRTASVAIDDLSVATPVIDLAAVVQPPVAATSDTTRASRRDEAGSRVKAGSSLLRQHCALTV